mgnify:CR=1 FL=1
MNKLILSLPIIIIFIISTFLLIFLLQNKDPNKPPSTFINEDVPKFNLVNLFDKNKFITNNNLNKKIVLINFFASWCAPCKAEHPLFFEIKAKNPQVYILGVDHKDKTKDAIDYLNIYGNPYDYIGVDKNGLVGLEFGVFGLPETFLVNNSGQIIYKYLGPLTKDIIKNEIQPLL